MTGRAETTLCLWTEYGGTVPDGWAGDAIYKVILKPTDEDEQVERSSAVASIYLHALKRHFASSGPGCPLCLHRDISRRSTSHSNPEAWEYIERILS